MPRVLWLWAFVCLATVYHGPSQCHRERHLKVPIYLNTQVFCLTSLCRHACTHKPTTLFSRVLHMGHTHTCTHTLAHSHTLANSPLHTHTYLHTHALAHSRTCTHLHTHLHTHILSLNSLMNQSPNGASEERRVLHATCATQVTHRTALRNPTHHFFPLSLPTT